ncbi:MAG: gliding motility-associated C-terminal domain-containing protein [Chitinophagales bacterium]|nr:gliding motility-associated C-terminal domain-containing protein [Chitinophagales bacterium]
MSRILFMLVVFLLSTKLIFTQCIIPCNSNVGIFSTNNASTIAYDNMGSAFHSTYSVEEIGNRFWGEQMQSDGISNLLTPQFINPTNYPVLTGKIYHIGIGSNSISDVQYVVLTSTGLFVGGTVQCVISSQILGTNSFSKISVNGKLDGLPTGITPDSVKMMFVTQGSIIITTCGGHVFVLSIHSFIRGGRGGGSNTTWSQVMQSVGKPLTNVIAVRGCPRVAYALKNDSTIWTWGEGILRGDGSGFFSSDSAIQMTLPSGVTGVKMIQSTRMTTNNFVSYYLLGTNQRVYSLGKNNFGQLGDRTTIDKLVWVNCKYPNNSDITDAAWISSNEHDPYYASLAIINKSAQIYTCGYNSKYMVGRNFNEGTNFLGIPAGISASDTILHCEVGGHTTAFIKIRTPRYGYVGHLVNGSVGNGSSNDNMLSSVDFITPPVISICGTLCDTPRISKKPMICRDTSIQFVIKNREGNKIFYRINNGSVDSIIIGIGDSSILTIKNPNTNTIIQITRLVSTKYFCDLNLNIRDTHVFKGNYYYKNALDICTGDSTLWRGSWRKLEKLYSDTLKTQYNCDSIIYLNLKVVDSFVTRLYDTICRSKSKFFNGANRIANGIYKDTLYSVKGCDSLIYLHLFVADTTRKDSFITICYNDSILFNDKILRKTGIYKDTLQNSFGCDHYLYLHLTVNDSSSSTRILIQCKGSIVSYNNQNITSTGFYRDTLKNRYGCDSFDYLNLTFLDTSSIQLYDTTCQNAPVFFNGSFRTSSGLYIDTLLNQSNCDSFVYLHLVVVPEIVRNLTINICQGKTYTFKGENINATGVYYDTLKSKRGCDSFVVLNLTVHPLPIVDAGLDKTRVNCSGDSVRLGTASQAGIVYSWLPINGLDNPASAMPWCKVNSTQKFILTVINSATGCLNKDSVNIAILNSTLIATKTTQNLKCFNDSSGILAINANNGYLPYMYSINNIIYQNANIITNLKAAKIASYYTRDSKGCIYSDTFSLSQPDPITIQTTKSRDLLCFNDSTGEIEINPTGGTMPYKYIWNLNNNYNNYITKLRGGNYTITVTDTNQCSNSKTIFIFEPKILSLLKIDTISNPCFKDSLAQILIVADGGVLPYNYLWSNGASANKISYLKEGKYWLIITDKNACKDTFYFQLKDPPLLTIDTVYRTKLNCGNYATLDIRCSGGTPNYLYSADSGFNYKRLQKQQVYKAGEYTVKVKDKNHCQASKLVAIEGVEIMDIDVIPDDTVVKLNETILLKFKIIKGDSNRIESIKWSPTNGLSCSDCPNPIVNSYVSENYTLEAVYNENCIARDKVHIKYKDEIFYIPNAFTPASQDPNNNQVRIYSNNVFSAKLVIFNRWGEKVFESNEAHRIGWNGKYHGQPAPMAVYIYYAEITYLNGKKAFKTGDVTLIR